jgi:predicted amidohydrolase YtcJ
VTRRTREGWLLAPEEALSAEEAVRAYTVGGAYAAFAEADLGTLSVGKWADFVVLDRDLLGAEAEELEEARVLYTAVGGEVVYEAA